jgi:hypothetical protein
MKHSRICVVVVAVIATAACTDDALCADEVSAVSVGDFFEDGDDGVTVTREDAGMVTLIARERGIAVRADFPTDVDIDDVVGDVQLAVGTNILGEGTESNYLTIVDERGLLFSGGRHPTFDDAAGGGYDADSPFIFGEATGARCDESELHAVRIAFDDAAVNVDNTPVAGTLRGVSVHAQAMGAWQRSFFATEYVADGYDIGPHTEGNMVAWAWRTR